RILPDGVGYSREVPMRPVNEDPGKKFADKVTKATQDAFEKGASAAEQAGQEIEQSYSACCRRHSGFQSPRDGDGPRKFAGKLRLGAGDSNRKRAVGGRGALVIRCPEAVGGADRAI